MPPHDLTFYPAGRRGYTLIEMALVMGVIGTVVGSIIGASSVARYRTSVNQAVDELGVVANNMRSYYNGRAGPAAASLASCPLSSFSSSYAVPVGSGVFPSEMTAQGVANNAWNLTSSSATVFIDLCYSASLTPPARQFVVRYANLTATQCTDLVVRSSMLASGMNLNQIIVTQGGSAPPAPVTLSTVPTHSTTGANATGAVDPVSASAACSVDGVTVDWYYQLSG